MTERLCAEVLVVGAGPAGIAAACRAAESGAEVLMLDEMVSPGGQIWRGPRPGLPTRARRWLERLESSTVRVLPATTVIEADAAGTVVAERDSGSVEIEGGCLILATGARELFLPFPGWTLPGVLGVGAAQALLKSGASFSGQRVVVAGSGPLLLPVAAALRRDGARLALVAEQAPAAAVVRFAASLWRWPAKLVEAASYRCRFLGCSYRLGTWVVSASGAEQVEEVELTDGRRSWSETCDLLFTAYGLVANLELAQRLGCRVHRGRVEVDTDQRTSVTPVLCAGEPTGIGGAELASLEGEIAGLVAAGRDAGLAPLRRRRDRLRCLGDLLQASFAPRAELAQRVNGETIVCRCEDVAWGRLEPAWDLRQAKLYTRLGMGPCQGRVCGAAMAVLAGWSPDSVRPPLKPCRVGSLGPPRSASAATAAGAGLGGVDG